MVSFNDLITSIKLHVQSHLVVTAAACVQLLANIPCTLDQSGLHKTVDVFAALVNLKFAIDNLLFNILKFVDDNILFIICDNVLFGKHSNMCDAAVNILFKKLLVKRNRSIKIMYKLVRFFCEASAPKFHDGFLLSLIY